MMPNVRGKAACGLPQDVPLTEGLGVAASASLRIALLDKGTIAFIVVKVHRLGIQNGKVGIGLIQVLEYLQNEPPMSVSIDMNSSLIKAHIEATAVVCVPPVGLAAENWRPIALEPQFGCQCLSKRCDIIELDGVFLSEVIRQFGWEVSWWLS